MVEQSAVNVEYFTPSLFGSLLLITNVSQQTLPNNQAQSKQKMSCPMSHTKHFEYVKIIRFVAKWSTAENKSYSIFPPLLLGRITLQLADFHPERGGGRYQIAILR
jgi:hypothetical protein